MHAESRASGSVRSVERGWSVGEHRHRGAPKPRARAAAAAPAAEPALRFAARLWGGCVCRWASARAGAGRQSSSSRHTGCHWSLCTHTHIAFVPGRQQAYGQAQQQGTEEEGGEETPHGCSASTTCHSAPHATKKTTPHAGCFPQVGMVGDSESRLEVESRHPQASWRRTSRLRACSRRWCALLRAGPFLRWPRSTRNLQLPCCSPAPALWRMSACLQCRRRRPVARRQSGAAPRRRLK
jgi:hypothetical protein